MSPGGGRSRRQRHAAPLADILGQELGFLRAVAARCLLFIISFLQREPRALRIQNQREEWLAVEPAVGSGAEPRGLRGVSGCGRGAGMHGCRCGCPLGRAALPGEPPWAVPGSEALQGQDGQCQQQSCLPRLPLPPALSQLL